MNRYQPQTVTRRRALAYATREGVAKEAFQLRFGLAPRILADRLFEFVREQAARRRPS